MNAPRKLLASLLLCVACAAVAGERVVIHLHNGSPVMGEIIWRQSGKVMIERHGGSRIVLSEESIKKIEPLTEDSLPAVETPATPAARPTPAAILGPCTFWLLDGKEVSGHVVSDEVDAYVLEDGARVPKFKVLKYQRAGEEVVEVRKLGAAKGSSAPQNAPGGFGGNAVQQQALRQALKDLKLTLTIEVEGELISSDATHREGNRVTLIDADYNKIMQDPAAVQKLNPASGDIVNKEIIAAPGNEPGRRYESKPEIKIEFR